jgi:hypothetical protein
MGKGGLIKEGQNLTLGFTVKSNPAISGSRADELASRSFRILAREYSCQSASMPLALTILFIGKTESTMAP